MPLLPTPYPRHMMPDLPLYAVDAGSAVDPYPRSLTRVFDAVWVFGSTDTNIIVESGTFWAEAYDPVRHPITTFQDAADWADTRLSETRCFVRLADRPDGYTLTFFQPAPGRYTPVLPSGWPDRKRTERFLTSVRDGLPDPPDGYAGWFRLSRLLPTGWVPPAGTEA